MNDQPPFATSPFDAIRKIDEQGHEYWSARELGRVLGYQTNYRNFQKAIAKAQKACEESGYAVSDHFAQTRNMVPLGSGAKRPVEDMHLSRYGAYLTVQNADPEKPVVALGQTYFAVQTRAQEIAEQIATLPEDQRRLIYRSEIAGWNQKLNDAAKLAGVISPGDFATFTNHGYQGLYGGLTEDAIHARKKLAEKERILDFMGSEELADNIFRTAQTDAKLRRENIKGKGAANQTHFEVGRKVRQTIADLGGTMPEDLSTPDKSIQQLQREEQTRIEQSKQPLLFPSADEQS
jgi:DNA-damage-inducible protein D